MPSVAPAKDVPELRDYEVLEKIAEGSMAAVYRGRRRADGQLVAVKVPFPSVTGNAVLFERFQREFRLGSTLDHPNIVRALDFGRADKTWYLVLEYVEGCDLWEKIRAAGRLSEREAVDVICQAGRGLHAAHQHGVIHRDVKPDNILVGLDGVAKMADLGLIKDLEAEQELTGAHKGLGTPNFIAPEQFTEARSADVRCDVYALAATLYMAVTGELPFDAKNLSGTLRKKQNNELVPPRQLVPALSERLDWTVRRALQADPKRRHASCLEFIQALTADGPVTPADVAAQKAPHAVRPSRASDRRRAVRYPCTLVTVCNLATSIHPDQDEIQDEWQVKIQNLSVSGMGMWLNRRFEPGTIVTVVLSSPDRSFKRETRLNVTHAYPGGPERWIIGGCFIEPLQKEELRKLL